LKTHPTSANGYYARDLLTLVGPLEELMVPPVRKGNFHPRILLFPYRKRASLELFAAILAVYAVGKGTRKISTFLAGIYKIFCSPQSISRLIEVASERVGILREKSLSEVFGSEDAAAKLVYLVLRQLNGA